MWVITRAVPNRLHERATIKRRCERHNIERREYLYVYIAHTHTARTVPGRKLNLPLLVCPAQIKPKSSSNQALLSIGQLTGPGRALNDGVQQVREILFVSGITDLSRYRRRLCRVCVGTNVRVTSYMHIDTR